MLWALLIATAVILISAEGPISDSEKTLRPLLLAYKEAVYTKNYDRVAKFYHPSAVLVETDKQVYYQPKKIVEAIKKYYANTGADGKTNATTDWEEFSGSGPILSYNSTWTMKGDNGILHGPYFQIWLRDVDEWKIYHDEFSISQRNEE